MFHSLLIVQSAVCVQWRREWDHVQPLSTCCLGDIVLRYSVPFELPRLLSKISDFLRGTRASVDLHFSVGLATLVSYFHHGIVLDLQNCDHHLLLNLTNAKACVGASICVVTGIFQRVLPRALDVIYTLPPDHLWLDSAPDLGPLISRWDIDKFENCRYKSVRILEVL